jgi:hypothetical protein
MITLEEQKTIECVVHTVKMGDVEDPDLFVAEPIWKWQQTEEGKWIMQNSNPTPMWKRIPDNTTYGYLYSIHAYLKPKDYTYWSLKFK